MQALLIKWAIIILVPLLVGAGGMWKYKDAQVKAAVIELTVAKEANAKSQATIIDQKHEIEKQVQTCSIRIVAKDRLIKEFQRVLKLKGVNSETGDTGSDILSELNGLYKTDSPDGVRPANNSPAPAGK